MDTKKYLSLERLTEYDALIKANIDEKISNKQDKTLIVTKDANNLASHTPVEILAYTQNGANVVFYDGGTYHTYLEGNANTAIFYSSYVDASRIQFTIYQVFSDKTIQGERSSYTPPVKSVNGKTGAVTLAASDVNADESGAAAQALAEAKTYADGVKNDLLNGAGDAYDTLKELGDLIDENVDAIDALEAVATNKMNKSNPNGDGSLSINRMPDTTIGEYSVSVGYANEASGDYSFAECFYTVASGDRSHAEGDNTIASGYCSHAEGSNTTASGYMSHAEGDNTIASGECAHAEGYYATASGDWSHAEGDDTLASGEWAHAEGGYTIASARWTHAEGCYTVANSAYQHVQGKFNAIDVENEKSIGTYAHIVGNGDDEDVRSNAHTLDWDGNAWFAGDVYVGSTSGTNKDSGSKKLATIDEIPVIPTNISAFANDAGYLTEHQSLDGLATESYVDEQLATKADVSHNHNDTYYTKTEIDNLELITVNDIDAICGGAIQAAEEVSF